MQLSHGSRIRRLRRAGATLVAVPVVAGLLTAPAGAATGTPEAPLDAPGLMEADHILRSTPDNIVWGGFPIDLEPGLTMGSGETVRIDTLTGNGFTNPNVTPAEYFAPLGVQPEELLPDGLAFWESVPTRTNYGGHVLTGPIYVEGAEPGDTIEIEILDLETRVPYGVNSTGPTSGVMSTTYPGWREGDEPLDIVAQIPEDAPGGVLPDVRHHLYRTGTHLGEEVVFFDEDVIIPQHKFMGVMAVAPPTGEIIGRTEDAPPPAHGVQTSIPPGKFGGNLDVRDLTEGATLYLPVFQDGAQIFMGDAHSAQGDGEVSGTAVEHSLAGTFRMTVHKGVTSDGPWAETADHWIMMGIDWDLDRAMRFAVQDTIDFLVEEKGMTDAKAYSFASLNVNYKVAEVVDGTQVVTGMIPKGVFVDGPVEPPTTEPPAEEPTTDDPTTDVPATEEPTTGTPSAAPTTGVPAAGGAGGAGGEPTSASGELPSTGAGVAGGVVAALTLLLAGAVALAVRRRHGTQ